MCLLLNFRDTTLFKKDFSIKKASSQAFIIEKSVKKRLVPQKFNNKHGKYLSTKCKGGGSPTASKENQLVPMVLSATKWGWVVVLPKKVQNPVSHHGVWY